MAGANDENAGPQAEAVTHEKNAGWADTPRFRRLFLAALGLCGVASALAGFIWKKDHPHFTAEAFPIFFALWGFAAFMFIVLAGQHLRRLVGREEGYYDERE